MTRLVIDSAHLRAVIATAYAGGASAAGIIAAVEKSVASRRLVVFDPYTLAGGELASAVLREEAAAMNPYGAARPVVLGVAAALDEVQTESLEGVASA